MDSKTLISASHKCPSILVNHTLAKTKSALPLAALSVPPGVVGGDILPLANRGSAFSHAPDNTTLF